jgi:sugar phosphate permease
MSFVSIMHMREDLHLKGQEVSLVLRQTRSCLTEQFSWLITCIYIAILVVEYPTNYLIQRLPVAKYLSISIIMWGATLSLHAACKNFASILTVRTLLGVFEAVSQPAFLVLSSQWYRRDEQAMIVTYWYCMNGAQQIVGGLLAYVFSLPMISGGSVTSWQAFFITLGCLSVLWGIFVLLWMPDSAMSAKCFSEADKMLMVERVRSNQTGLQNRQWRKEQLKEAFLDPQMYAYCLIALTTTIPTSGLGSFANIIITESFHFDPLQTQLIAIPRGIAIIIILLSSTWLVNRTGQNLFVMAIYVIPSIIGTILLITFESTTGARKIGLLISYHIVLTFWAAQGLAMSMISRNVAGQTKKSIVVAANFACWAIGNSIGM